MQVFSIALLQRCAPSMPLWTEMGTERGPKVDENEFEKGGSNKGQERKERDKWECEKCSFRAKDSLLPQST